MSYTIKIDKVALKFINKQPRDKKLHLLSAIYKLPNQGDRRRLEGAAKGTMRLRVGDYRVIYTVDHGQLIVRVVDADNRGDIYKRY